MTGWRKLLAWFLVWAMTVSTIVLNKDIGETAGGILERVTMAFFLANALKPAANGVLEKYRNRDAPSE